MAYTGTVPSVEELCETFNIDEGKAERIRGIISDAITASDNPDVYPVMAERLSVYRDRGMRLKKYEEKFQTISEVLFDDPDDRCVFIVSLPAGYIVNNDFFSNTLVYHEKRYYIAKPSDLFREYVHDACIFVKTGYAEVY